MSRVLCKREGMHCCVCLTKRKCSPARFLVVSKLLFGNYSIVCPRRTSQTVELEAQVDESTGVRRFRRKSEIKQYQQLEEQLYSKIIYGYQGYGQSFLSEECFV